MFTKQDGKKGENQEHPPFRNNIQQCAVSPSADFPALQRLNTKFRTFPLQACRKPAPSLAGENPSVYFKPWEYGELMKTENFRAVSRYGGTLGLLLLVAVASKREGASWQSRAHHLLCHRNHCETGGEARSPSPAPKKPRGEEKTPPSALSCPQLVCGN